MDNLKRVREALEFFGKLDNYAAPFKEGDIKKGVRPKFDFADTPTQRKGFDIAKEALKELDSFIESNGWQDIKSAPKDGSSFLAITLDDGITGCSHYDKVRWESNVDKMEYGYEGLMTGQISPDDNQVGKYLSIEMDFYTHWQPLPAIKSIKEEV